jgi:hypothetical protein
VSALGGDLLGTCGAARAEGQVQVVHLPKRSSCILPITGH